MCPTPRQIKRGQTQRYLSLVVPLKKAGDEAVHKELGDRIEKAATTASSLEAEWDSGTDTVKQIQSVLIDKSSKRSTLAITWLVRLFYPTEWNELKSRKTVAMPKRTFDFRLEINAQVVPPGNIFSAYNIAQDFISEDVDQRSSSCDNIVLASSASCSDTRKYNVTLSVPGHTPMVVSIDTGLGSPGDSASWDQNSIQRNGVSGIRRRKVGGLVLEKTGLEGATQLIDYGFHFNKIPIYCDSKSAIAISCNPVQHSRTKHIAVHYHFIKEHVEKGTIEPYFVKTDYQLADLFTKALLVDQFNYLVHRLGMRSLSPHELERLAKSRQNQRDLPRNTPLDRVEVLGAEINHCKAIFTNDGLPLYTPFEYYLKEIDYFSSKSYDSNEETQEAEEEEEL
ncbi:hypothetical protein Tco_0797261 [Tanacetum coccineum]